MGASWIVGLMFTVVTGSCALWRVVSGTTGLMDLAVYHSALLNTFQERFYFTSLFPKGILFYQHFDPVTVLYLPVYALAGNGGWVALCLSQAVAVGLAFPAVVRLGRHLGLPPRAALVVPLLMAANPVLHNIVWYDFHPFVLAVPLLVWGWVWLLEGRIGAGSACWVVAMLCKENVPLTVASLGGALMLLGRRRTGGAWLAAGLGAFLLINGAVIPRFREIGTGSVYLDRYGWLGESAGQIVKTLLFSPWVPARHLFAREQTWSFLAGLLLPLGLLPLLAPRVALAALPELAVLLLAVFSPMQSLKFHYPAVVTAVLLIAATHGLARLVQFSACPAPLPPQSGTRRLMPGTRRLIPGALLLFAALSSCRILYTDGRTLPFLRLPRKQAYYRPEQRLQEIEEIGRLIPEESSLTVPVNLLNPLFPFVQRPLISLLPDRAGVADYIVFDTSTGYFGGYKDAGLAPMLSTCSSDPALERIYEKNGFFVFRRKEPLDPDRAHKILRWRELGPAG